MIDKDLAYLVVGKLIQAVVAILSIKVMTSMLPSTEVGYQYLILSVTLWFSWVLINPVGMFVNRHFHEWHRDGHLVRILSKMNSYFIFVAVVSIPVVFLVQNVTELERVYSRGEVVLFVCIYIYFSTWFQTGVSFFNLIGLQKDFVTLTLIAQVSGLAIAWLGISIWDNAIVWLAGLLIGQMIGLLTMHIYFRKKIISEKVADLSPPLFSKETIIYCVPVAISTLCMWFLGQGYRIIVESKMGVEALASLGVGLGLAANFAGVVESITGQYLQPNYYSALSKIGEGARKDAWETLWNKTTIIYVSMLCFSIAISHLLVRVVAAPSFHHVAYITIFGCVIEFLRQSTNVSNLAFHGEKKTQFSVAPHLFGAIVLCFSTLVLVFVGKLTIVNLLWALVSSILMSYLVSLLLIRSLFSYHVKPLLWLKIFLVSCPAAFPVIFVNTDTSVFTNFSVCTLSGLWAIAIIYYFVKVSSRPI